MRTLRFKRKLKTGADSFSDVKRGKVVKPLEFQFKTENSLKTKVIIRDFWSLLPCFIENAMRT